VVVLVVAAIIVLIPVGLVGFFLIKGIAHDGLDGRGAAKTATSFSDLDVVCDNGSISNAAAYGKPYIAVFAPETERSPLSNVSPDHWSEVSFDSVADYRVNREAFGSTNVVACLSRKPGTEVKSRTCEFKLDSGEQVSVDYYAVQYNIDLREAKTGKHIEQLGAVNGPATSCPALLWVDRHNRKQYAGPDSAAVDAELSKFAAS
jgi:hypothetical protein